MLLHESVQTNWKQLALNSLFSALITAVVAVIVFSIAHDPILGGLLTLAGIVLSLSSIGRFSYLEIGSRAHLLIRCSVPITFLLHIPISIMGWYWLQHRAFLDEVTTASTNGAMTGSSLSTLWVHVLTSLHPQPSSTLAHTSHPRLLHSSIPLSVTFLFLILYNGTAIFSSRMRGGEEESSSLERKLRHGIFSVLNLSSVAGNQPATTVQTAHVLMMHVTSWVLGSVTGLSLELSNCLHDHAAQFALATMQAILVNALAGFVLSHIWFHFFQDHHWNAEAFETE